MARQLCCSSCSCSAAALPSLVVCPPLSSRRYQQQQPTGGIAASSSGSRSQVGFSTAACCGGGLQHQQRRRGLVCASAGERAPAVTSVAVDPLHPISGRALEPAQCVLPTAVFLGAVGMVVTFLLRVREKKAAIRERPDVDAAASQDGAAAEADPRHHQRVLAKARQATHISSAVTYYKAGEYTKAKLELAKALAENSICRAPAVLAHTGEEMANLYRLHIRFTEQPPSFATLLQLQEMLGISQEDAERIELELLRSPGAFAI